MITVVATSNTATTRKCIPELHRMVFGAGHKATASRVMRIHHGVPGEVIDRFTMVESE